VLLFDEPLSNLDAKLRSEMRIELRELQRRLGVTSLYVTHDLEEALAMSDQIVVMRDGLIEQNGTPAEIYNYPRTAFVADFVGSANLVSGAVLPDRSDKDRVAIRTDDGQMLVGATHGRPFGQNATLSLRTVHLRLVSELPAGAANIWPITIRRTVFLGDVTQIHVGWGGRELIVRQTVADVFTPGQTAFLRVDPEQCILLEG